MDVLIGREDKTNRLLVAVMGVNGLETKAIGMQNSVPLSVSRCLPEEETAHCLIKRDDKGNMTITNLKSTNITCVEGISVQTKRITPTSAITLGDDRYPLNMSEVMQVIAPEQPISAPAPTPTDSNSQVAYARCDIRRLQRVYEQYEQNMDTITKRKDKKLKFRLIPLMLGSFGTALSAVLGLMHIPIGVYITGSISVLSFTLYVLLLTDKDKSAEDKKNVQNWLYDQYVCPNVGRFLGNTPYKLLKQQGRCPYCHGKRVV